MGVPIQECKGNKNHGLMRFKTFCHDSPWSFSTRKRLYLPAICATQLLIATCMYLFKKTADIQTFLQQSRANYRLLGFVPTMGALHKGHLDLIQRSRSENQVTICSIFVNPTRFNESTDLEKYPRTPAKDLLLLEKVGCDIVFLPTVDEIYPDGTDQNLEFDFAGLDQRMEGQSRPGHFVGVAQVVKRLLKIVQPDKIYLGQKDYQQFRIVQSMIEQTALSVKATMVPTVREADGLALSSRNIRLKSEERGLAPLLYHCLREAKIQLGQGWTRAEIEAHAMARLAKPSAFRPEYFSLVDGLTLEPIDDPAEHKIIVACTAVWVGDIRLIDNMLLKGGD